MFKISCDTCLDLMPLVKDGVASKDSENLVKEHISQCENCRKIYDEEMSEPMPKMNEKKIVKKIKRSGLFFIITVILLGISMGMIITDSMNMFYNALIMPAIGCFGYLILMKKAYIAPMVVFISSFIFDFINSWLDINSRAGLFEKISVSTMNGFFYAFIYTFFCLIGVAIGFCFSYALRKDEENENK